MGSAATGCVGSLLVERTLHCQTEWPLQAGAVEQRAATLAVHATADEEVGLHPRRLPPAAMDRPPICSCSSQTAAL